MNECKCGREASTRTIRTLTFAILLFAFAASVFCPVPALAQFSRAVDRITGDPVLQLNWSEGNWTSANIPVPGCKTFEGGVSTPNPAIQADSVVCNQVPNGWHWTVELPGQFMLSYDFNGIPPGLTVCGQIFMVRGASGVKADVHYAQNWMTCTDAKSGGLIWTGPFSDFDPEELGFLPLQATRCGVIRTLPTGACCQHDGTCSITIEEDCPPPGIWQSGLSCTPNPCPQPSGACCFHDGHCDFVTEVQCALQGGIWQGMDVPCDPNPCPQPPGACCFPDGHCELLTSAVCAASGGTWLGMDVPCTPSPCLQPPGACCFRDGTCQLVPQAVCDSLGGNWLGSETTCSPNPCPQPPGACCFPDGTCRLLTQADCVAASGNWLGMDTVCEPQNPCPIPQGACCLPSNQCVITTQLDCEQHDGIYYGDNVPCDQVPCPIVPIEQTNWGRIKAKYR